MQHSHFDGHTVHHKIERLMRHRLLLSMVVGMMSVAIVSFAKKDDPNIKYMYSESFSLISTHMHHEHPTHGMAHARISKLPTISGI